MSTSVQRFLDVLTDTPQISGKIVYLHKTEIFIYNFFRFTNESVFNELAFTTHLNYSNLLNFSPCGWSEIYERSESLFAQKYDSCVQHTSNFMEPVSIF